MTEQTTIEYAEARLTSIGAQHAKVKALDSTRKATQRTWDDQIGEAKAEVERLIEAPLPAKSDERKGRIQAIQKAYQSESEARSGKATEMAEIRADLKEARARLAALIEDDGQLDLEEWLAQEPQEDEGSA